MELKVLGISNVIDSATYGGSTFCIVLARSSKTIELWVENCADSLDDGESENGNEKLVIAWKKTCKRRVRHLHRLNYSIGKHRFGFPRITPKT